MFASFNGILWDERFRWYFMEVVIFRCYTTNFSKRQTNLLQTSPEKTVDPSSQPEKNFIRQRSLSIAAAAPGKTTSAADEENLGVERNLTTLYKSVRWFPNPPSSPALDRLPEWKGAGGRRLRLGVALVWPALDCSERIRPTEHNWVAKEGSLILIIKTTLHARLAVQEILDHVQEYRIMCA